MIRISIFLVLFLSTVRGAGQQLSQVSFAGGSQLSHLALLTDREVLIRISDDGRVLEWGVELASFRNSNYYAYKLQPYPGRIDFYGPESDSIFRGKVRTIGSSVVTYYPATETELKRGKIRSIGSLFFEYHDHFEHPVVRGKIKSIGNIVLQYYSSFDEESLRGKIKSIGNTSITWYTVFDDRLIRGKIKSIGPIRYTWYTSLETQYGGGLKSGSYRQNIGGVVYILQ